MHQRLYIFLVFIFSVSLGQFSVLTVVAQNECYRVKFHTKISASRGEFTGVLDNSDWFGAPALLGDVDGDGIADLAVAASKDDDGGIERGAVWILFMNVNGTVKSHQKISDTQGGFTGILGAGDSFGHGIVGLGDLNEDGVPDLATGAQYDDDGGIDRGAVWILFLNSNGTVKSHQKISDTQGNFLGVLDNDDNFGNYLGKIDDLNSDGIVDLAVGAIGDDDGGTSRGAVWLLFLDTNGTVKSHQKISDTQGNFTGVLNNNDVFGRPTGIGDLNLDGISDLAVGAAGDDDGGTDRGAVWILFMDTNQMVKSHQKISDTQGNFNGILNNSDVIANNVRSIGDLNQDGINDLVVSAQRDDDGGTNRGAVWILLMDTTGLVKQEIKISDIEGNFVGNLNNSDEFGSRLSYLEDYNNDGYQDIAVSALRDDDGGFDKGAVWILSLEICPDTCVPGTQRIFQKIYRHIGNERAHSLQQTSDGGFVIAGQTNGAGAGSYDWFVMKTDKDGDTLWAKTYGSNAEETGFSITIKQTTDSGYVVAGRTYGFGSVSGAVFVMKLDVNGDVSWEKKIDGSAFEHARDIIQTKDGGFILSGTNGYFIRLNADGSMRWNKYYSGGINMHFTHVNETPSGNFMISGTSNYGLGTNSSYMLLVDSGGTKIWERIYDAPFNQGFLGMEQTADEGFVFCGLTQTNSSFSGQDILLMKTDSNGIMEWNRTYRLGNNRDRGIYVGVTNDGGYIVTAYTESVASGNNLIFKTDSHGNVEWAKVYPGNSNVIETWYSDNIVQTNDGGYAFVNYTSLGGLDNNAYLIKMNNCGESGCNETDVTFTVGETDLTTSNPNSSITSHGVMSNTNATVGSFIVNDSLLCEFDPLCQLLADFSADTVCLGDTTRFTDLSTDALANVTGWKWYFGDGDSLIGVENAAHHYKDSGTYMVKLVVFNNDTTFCSDSITLPVRVVNPFVELGNDTSICYGNNFVLNAFSPKVTYLWQDNSTNSTFIVDTTGSYHVMVEESGCFAYDTIQLTFPLPPNLDLGADTALCMGDSLLVDATTPSVTYLWQDNTTDSIHLVKTSGTYWAEVNTGVCRVRDSIDITFENQPIVELGNDTIICEGEVLQLDAFNMGSTYLWSDNSFDTTLDVSSAGLYWVSVTSALGACNTRDSITVNYDTIPALNLGSDTILCDGDSLLIDATIPFVTYLWQDNTTDSIHLVKTSGTYWVEVNTGVCITRDSIDLLFESSIAVDFGPDTILCEGSDLVLNATNNGSTYFWQDGSVLSSLTISDSGFYWVTVTSSFGSCVVSDSIHVDYDPIPSVNLGNDTSLCEGDSILLDATFPGASYLWNDGSTNPNLLVTSQGSYVVDLSLGNCTSSEAIVVLFDSLPIFDLGPNRTICENDTIQINLKDNWEQYQWSSGDSTATVFFGASGRYDVTVINGACSSRDTIQLRVNPLPNRLEQQRYVLCDENAITIDAGNPGSSYLWSSGETTQTIVVSNAGRYDVTITTKDGCSLTDVFAVERCTTNIFIPNTITPNGDGKNDSWIIRNIDAFPGNTVQIFNRNGYLLFETTNYQNDWNGIHEGRELPAGVYYYVLDLKGNGGLHKGTLTILRQK